jgi:anti-sigma-K factor RskA
MSMIDKEPERHEIEALLPWYAAGTLSRREADLVERVLAGDRELARRYDVVRQELAETIRLNETLGAPSARAMEKLFAAIDVEETGGARAQRRRLGRKPSLAMASTLNNDAPGA